MHLCLWRERWKMDSYVGVLLRDWLMKPKSELMLIHCWQKIHFNCWWLQMESITWYEIHPMSNQLTWQPFIFPLDHRKSRNSDFSLDEIISKTFSSCQNAFHWIPFNKLFFRKKNVLSFRMKNWAENFCIGEVMNEHVIESLWFQFPSVKELGGRGLVGSTVSSWLSDLWFITAPPNFLGEPDNLIYSMLVHLEKE